MLAAAISRYWPFANGSGRILDKYARSIDLGSGERTAQTSDGFTMQVLADDLIGRHILMSGKFDRSIVQVLLDRAKPGDVLLDIGANIGYVSACFLKRVPGSHAICVEPQPGIVDLLHKNVRQFDGRAIVKPVALSDKPGELRFHIDKDNRGSSKISPDGEISVIAVSAAELLAGVERVDLVKVDVEGHEEPVFRAMRNELKRLKPRAILFEDHGDGAAPQDGIGLIMTGLGYRVFGIDKRLLKTRLVLVEKSADCQFNDYLACA